MSGFLNLFKWPIVPWDGKSPIHDPRPGIFPLAVKASRRLHLWSTKDIIPDSGVRLLIGVATWSRYDMVLLDIIDDAEFGPACIDVIDIDQIQSIDDLHRFFPHASPIMQSPIVGLWSDGHFVECADGHFGREIVARECGIDKAHIEERMMAIFNQRK